MAAQEPPNPPPTSSSSSSSSNPQAIDTSGHRSSPHSTPQMSHPMHSSVGGPFQSQEQNDHGQGLYAVQYSPFMGMMPEFNPSMLIPLTYKIPTRANSAGATGEEQGQGGEAVRQQHGAQRQVVVRRFQLAFQLDLALLLKLAFAVVLFGQDGSSQRTIVLVLLASLVYLYQTGVLTPLIRYARQGLAPPQPPARPQNAAVRQNDGQDNQPDNAAGVENENQPAVEANQQAEPERANGINLWGIAREIQTFIVGFIASLLPGFEHPHND